MKIISKILPLSLVFTLLMTCMLTFSVNAKITDVVDDGGFENADDNWTYADGESTGITRVNDANKAHSGNSAVYFDGTAKTWSGLVQDVTVKPNTFYIFNYYTNLSGGRLQVYIIGVVDGVETGDRLVEQYSRQDGGINEKYDIGWYSEKLKVINSGDNTTLRIRISCADGEKEPKKTQGYFDDVSLVECTAIGLPIGASETSSTTSTPDSTEASTTSTPDSTEASTTSEPDSTEASATSTPDSTEATTTSAPDSTVVSTDSTASANDVSASTSNSSDSSVSGTETSNSSSNDATTQAKSSYVQSSSIPIWVIIVVIAVILIIASAAAFIIFKKKAAPGAGRGK